MNTGAEYVQGSDFVAEVLRTGRVKTAKIEVEKGIVTIAVPQSLDRRKIEELLHAKRQWIRDKITLHQAALPDRRKRYVSGEAFPYLGRNYRLKVARGEANAVKLVEGHLRLDILSDDRFIDQDARARRLVRRWYKDKAQALLARKSQHFGSIIGKTVGKVSVRDFKSRWGSCTPDGDLEFNWRIVLAPQRMVDYIVAHEVAHLVHHNHSKDFWQLVSRLYPNYRECREWLKENGHRLSLD